MPRVCIAQHDEALEVVPCLLRAGPQYGHERLVLLPDQSSVLLALRHAGRREDLLPACVRDLLDSPQVADASLEVALVSEVFAGEESHEGV